MKLYIYSFEAGFNFCSLIGGLWFLNSLASGGGYLPTIAFFSGAILLIVAIVNSVIRVLRR